MLAFVAAGGALEELRPLLVGAVRRDVVTWLASPKGGQLGTDLNRDRIAAAHAPDGVQPVRRVAIDDVWSGLRLRPSAS